MQSTKQKIERAALAGLAAASMDERERSTDISLAELAALVETAGGQPVVTLLQNKPTPDPRTFLGEGKVAELRERIVANDCDLAVFDNELSPSQMRVLEEELGVRVLDRSGLILDIFAQRAQTREGQLQVELAQYQYLLPRLTGMWTHLVRQTASGGSSPIGTRGPGETQLETDRRHIRRKIQKLQAELEDVRKIRRTQRRRREKNALPVVALVGYTNAGKSTLLNCLTGSDIPANDRLFDTLDTTTRRWRIDAAQEVLLSDTVGFIRKLPTHLVEAFKATLEELTYADVLLHVIDLSNPEWEAQAEVVDRLIDQLGAAQTPCIRVFNKCDAYLGILPHGENIVCISARSGEGAAELTECVRAILGRADHHVMLLLPYAQGALLETLHRDCAVLHTDYRDDGIALEVIIHPEQWPRLEPFVIAGEEGEYGQLPHSNEIRRVGVRGQTLALSGPRAAGRLRGRGTYNHRRVQKAVSRRAAQLLVLPAARRHRTLLRRRRAAGHGRHPDAGGVPPRGCDERCLRRHALLRRRAARHGRPAAGVYRRRGRCPRRRRHLGGAPLARLRGQHALRAL